MIAGFYQTIFQAFHTTEHQKVETILFSKKKHSRTHEDKKISFTLDKNVIQENGKVKHLGVILDQFLSFQEEVRKVLR